jgi:DNA-binding NtrC family response regulator
MAKILIADDERAICDAFSAIVRAAGHAPIIASSGREAIALAASECPAVVFMDVQMPEADGLSALAAITRDAPDIPVVMMTAYGTVEIAMEAMRQGAFDYLGKPLDIGQVRALIERALHRPQPAATGHEQGNGHGGNSSTPMRADRLVGNSAAMQTVFKMMSLLASNDFTVLLTGESGVGKELVARGIHTLGERRDRPFIAVNCAAIPDNLIESELFGHERGAFTSAGERRIGRFEAAADGTLLLDEIAELPYPLQSKLLRVLQERSFERVGSTRSIAVRARIIAATNRDPGAPDAGPALRHDLYHRLNLIHLHIPALRDRKEDIDALVQHFLAIANADLGKQLQGVDAEALDRLRRHSWPGNVRELENTIKRAALLARGAVLTVHDLAFDAAALGSSHAPAEIARLRTAARAALRARVNPDDPESGASAPVFQALVSEVEIELVEEALRITGDNQVAAARLLGVHRSTLRKKLAPE